MSKTKSADKHHGAQYAFFYLISLFSLGLLSISVGNVFFQLINKYVTDIVYQYSSYYNSGALKMAISSIVIAGPVYYLSVMQINKALYSGKLPNDSGIRKWLTYFVLLVSSVTILGYLIGILYSFLDGELTTKFLLKAMTALAISGSVFGYYLYDVKRKEVIGTKDKNIQISMALSIVVVVAALVLAFVFVESPKQTRMKKLDSEVISRLDQIETAARQYYDRKGALPENLNALLSGDYWIDGNRLSDPETGVGFGYNVLTNKTFELCASFRLATNEQEEMYRYGQTRWKHAEGNNCFEREVGDYKDDLLKEPVRAIEPVSEIPVE